MAKYFVIQEIAPEEAKEFAVVSHGEAYVGKWKRKVLFVHDWYENEDQARAAAHRLLYPS